MGGDTIGKVIILDLQDNDTLAFTEILAFLKKHPDFERYSLGQETILSLPGLEIHMDKRKVYRNNQEIKLTMKEYKILCFLVANRNRVLTYEQIYQRVWGEDTIKNESNAVAATSVICGKSCSRRPLIPHSISSLFGKPVIVFKSNKVLFLFGGLIFRPLFL